MAKVARVESVDALRAFKIVLIKFAEAANVALADAEGEVSRTLTWLETEAPTVWAGQVRKRQELLGRAQEALRQKRVFKDSSGRTPSAVEEEKAVAMAKRRLEEAQGKLTATRKYERILSKEMDLYKGQVSRFATAAQSDVPLAISKLDRLVQQIEAYLSLGPAAVEVGAPSEAGTTSAPLPDFDSMARATGQMPPTVPADSPDAEANTEVPAPEVLHFRTPDPAALVNASPGFAPGEKWKVRRLSTEDRARLPAGGLPIDNEDKVFLTEGIADAAWIFAEHTGAGWFFAPCEPAQLDSRVAPEEVRAIKARDLLAVRPDLRDILRLQRGWIAVVGAEGLVAVYDPRGVDVLGEAAPDPTAG